MKPGRLGTRSVFAVAVYTFIRIAAARAQVAVPAMPDIFSSPLPTGSGARAVGSGGAFIAVADDATAASWNPAGLVQLERPEMSVVFSNITYGFDPRETGDIEWQDSPDLNYMSTVYPFRLFDRNMVVSLNYQQSYDFTRRFEYRDARRDPGTGESIMRDIEFRRSGGISSVTPAWAVQITSGLSVGAAADIYVDELFGNDTFRQKTSMKGTAEIELVGLGLVPATFTESRSLDTENFSGVGATVGLLYDVTPRCSVGVRIDTPYNASAHFEEDTRSELSIDLPGGVQTTTTDPGPVTGSQRYRFPTTWGVGLAYRLSDAFTVMGDVTRVEQDQFEVKQKGGGWVHPATGDDSDSVDATHTVRLGAEYLVIRDKTFYPLRCGIFYDEEPAAGHPNNFWGFAAGTGLATDRSRLDLGYQLRIGSDTEIGGVETTTFNTQEHLVVLSTIIYF